MGRTAPTSLHLRNIDTTFVGVSSGVLLLVFRKIDNTKLFTKPPDGCLD